MADAKHQRKHKAAPGAADELRRQAEERLDRLSAAASPAGDDIAIVIHELRVHQIELEMQNEELRLAQFELQASREKYFELFDLAPVGYLTLDDKSVVRDANLTAARLLGVERQQLIAKPLTSFIFAADQDVYYRQQRMLEQTSGPQTFELRLRRADGEADGEAARDHFWAQLEGRPQPAADGEPLSIWVTFTDTTERKRSEDALRQSEERFAALFEQAPLGYQSLDEDGRFIKVNAAWLETLGYARDEVIGRWFGDFLAAEFVDAFHERFPLFKARGAIHSEFQMAHKDGGTRTIAFEGRVGYNPDGSFRQTHCILADVTEQRQAEAEIRRLNDELEERVLARTAELAAANNELEAFVYSASHDLRAPLRAIDGFSQMVVEDAAERLDAADEEHLQRVRAAARRMGLLIDGLLVLSRVARKDVLRECVDLSGMAASVIADLRQEAPERRVEAVVEPHLMVDADATLLQVLLTNLLGNAWKFTAKHETARIEVGVIDADGQRAFFVKDDGAGFDVHEAEHLFGPFQRFHTADQFEGDGIGLATVQRLVARHGGRVWAEAAVEEGATFYFTLTAEKT